MDEPLPSLPLPPASDAAGKHDPHAPLALWKHEEQQSDYKNDSRKKEKIICCRYRLLLRYESTTTNDAAATTTTQTRDPHAEMEATQTCTPAMMVEEADADFCRLFRFPSPATVQGRHFSSLFGPATNITHVQTLLRPSLCFSSSAFLPGTDGPPVPVLLNLYDAKGNPWSCRLTSRPLRPRHCLLTVTPLCLYEYCKNPNFFATLHPFSSSFTGTGEGRKGEERGEEDMARKKKKNKGKKKYKKKTTKEEEKEKKKEGARLLVSENHKANMTRGEGECVIDEIQQI